MVHPFGRDGWVCPITMCRAQEKHISHSLRTVLVVAAAAGCCSAQEGDDAGDVVAVAPAVAHCPLFLSRLHQRLGGLLRCRGRAGAGRHVVSDVIEGTAG